MAGGAGEYPAAATLDALFAARAADRPDAVALTCDDAALSYRELDRRSAALARRLAALGVRPGARVAILLERSLDLVVAVLGAVRAGAAYLPLDPAYPAERLAFTLQDSGAPVLVTRSETAAGLPEVAGVGRVLLDEPAPAAPAGAAPTGAAGSDAVAYVIYTSGSTGRPKGVPVRHRNVARLFDATARWFDFGSDDAWTLFHSYAFDFSVWELWGALLHGGRLVVVPHAVSRAPADFHRLLARERVSFLNQTPSAFRQLARADAEAAEPLAALRTVVFGGEALELETLAPWLSRYGDRRPTLVNMYGITETTVHVTYRPIVREDLGRGRGSVVGRPIPDLSLHLLDRRLEPVPLGGAGEIHVGGAGLAAGYLGRARLSAERFVPDAVGSSAPGRAGARLYRSGDLARRLADGDVEYLGRIDHQVKVRGFRIELGEVEAALAAHPDVGEAVVVAREAAAGEGEDRRLVAYVVPADPAAALTVAELRRFVGERLPEHMVPSAFVALESIPLTPNGKIDRRALPSPDLGRPHLGTGYVAPRDALERFLAGLWQRVLGVERVGVEDDFFDLGGNSLVGVTLIDRLQEALGEIVHVVVLFDAPSVARMADHLRRQHPEGVARITGERPAAAAADAEAAPPVDVEMVERVRALVRGMDRFTVGDAGSGEPRNPPAVFVLSAPRSGSTLLRVMLGGHPRLFAPPELELLSFDTLADRRRAFQGRDAFWLEGAIRAVMELEGSDAEAARRRIEELEAEGTSTRRFYRVLQEALGDRLLVDKTPSYALREDVLARAERDFEEACYVHLVRHPYGMIRSFEEARLDQIFFPAEHPFTRRQLAELIWLVSERNVRRFLETVPPRRQALVRFEDLVREPERTLRGLCAFLGLDYRPEMAQPYRDAGSERMTDGIHESSRMLGDVKFHRHEGVDAAVADQWRRHYDRDFLGEVSWRAARRYGYGSERAGGGSVRSLVGLRSGGAEPPLFLVHPASGDVYFYRDMVAALPAGRPVYGFQAPGLDGREEPLATVEELAERYVESLLAFRPEGPYLLAGSSLGGTVAYEMARRLTAAGHEVAFLGMGDTAGVRQLPEPFAGAEAEAMVLGYLAGPIGAQCFQALEALAPDDRPAFMVAELERAGRLREGLGEEALARLVRVIRSNQAAMIAYRPQPYEGPVAFFRAADGGSRYAEAREEPWRPLALGGLSVRVIPGNHLSMNLAPNAEHLARALQEEIERSVASARGSMAVAAASATD
jgi:amino acid adenylation domain-containing protein